MDNGYKLLFDKIGYYLNTSYYLSNLKVLSFAEFIGKIKDDSSS